MKPKIADLLKRIEALEQQVRELQARPVLIPQPFPVPVPLYPSWPLPVYPLPGPIWSSPPATPCVPLQDHWITC